MSEFEKLRQVKKIFEVSTIIYSFNDKKYQEKIIQEIKRIYPSIEKYFTITVPHHQGFTGITCRAEVVLKYTKEGKDIFKTPNPISALKKGINQALKKGRSD